MKRRYMAMSEVQPAERGTVSFQLVLAYLPRNEITPWATWSRNTDDGSTYWGHYFDSPDDAIDDYLDRCEQEGLDPGKFEECFECGGKATRFAFREQNMYGDADHTFTVDVPVEVLVCELCLAEHQLRLEP